MIDPRHWSSPLPTPTRRGAGFHRLRALGLVVLLALTACAIDSDKADTVFPQPTTPCAPPECHEIDVEALEYIFRTPNDQLTVPAGTVRFLVRNTGVKVHNLRLNGGGVTIKSANLPPGESTYFDVQLHARSYDIYCSITGHAEKGMRAVVHVTPARP
ncbi:MAG: hypothetical protein NZ518_12075 [Dehalococcoidia bacterium]|nr:hypothetical protein [Dehalococcoidia bacterium]